MLTYQYRLRNRSGHAIKGTVQAANLNDAFAKVRKLDGVVLDVKPVGNSITLKVSFLNRVPLKERIIFSEQLGVMLKAGITLVQALKGLEEEGQNKTLKRTLQTIITDVEGGTPFSGALAKHPRIFSRIFCEMIRSSEKTGNVAEILMKLSKQQQKEYDLKGKVRGALMYPAVVSVLLVGVIVLVITFILPKLSGMFKESNVELPASTRALLWLSDVFVNQWYLVIGLLVVLVVLFRLAIRTERGHWIWDSVILRVPVIGSLLRKTYLARFTQSFASLAQAGVPVLEAFKTLQGVVGNVVYEAEIAGIARDVEDGVKVSVAIRKSRYFPGIIGQLVSVGEQSGDLAGIFTILGDFFEQEVDGMTKNLSSLLEPIIMMVMGVVIGFILISVLQPIYGLVNTI